MFSMSYMMRGHRHTDREKAEGKTGAEIGAIRLESQRIPRMAGSYQRLEEARF
jgi:hypothetical protein